MTTETARSMKRLGNWLLLTTFVAVLGLIPVSIKAADSDSWERIAQVWGYTVFFGLIPATIAVYVIRWVRLQMSPEGRALLLEEEKRNDPTKVFHPPRMARGHRVQIDKRGIQT